jgi:parvulin-like peptidyl-prolyl isomerase
MKIKKPKKLQKLPKPNLKRLRRKKGAVEEQGALPRITNETVAAHREEVLSSARKYIYPLQHSKHRVVKISVSLLVLAVIGFFVYLGLALYKFQSTNTFVYGVTQVLPLPVAKAGSNFVSYDSYLFQLRRYMHYYRTQQQVDFSTKKGKDQLVEYKKRSMDKVLRTAYAKQLAKENGVTVSRREVDQQIDLVRSQNRLGSNDQVFKDVLSEYWGWTVQDFKQELTDELLEQKVVAKLDTAAQNKAGAAYEKLQQGADFAEVAKQYSEDAATAPNGGTYPVTIERTNRDVPPQLIAALFAMKPGEYSKVINTGYRLEIVKVISNENGRVQAAHIAINLQDITHFTDKVKAEHKPMRFIRF